MTKKATKIRKNSAHTFTVVLENINSKLDLVLDGHQVLDKKITDLHEEVGEFKAEVSYKFEFGNISLMDRVIMLAPGETILAHSNEFIGGRNHITTMMKARSSLGRSFIEVCKCAGWGDVGYINRWTMEITNNSKHYFIPLVVGRRIAQLIFFETGPILDRDYSKSGKYQTTTDIKKMMKEWDPKSMLPKLYHDRDIKKK